MFQSGIEFNQQKGGWIEVVCGPMFSGKTEELIRRMRRAQIAGQKVEIFKPASDIRYDEQEVVSHDKNSIPSTPIDNSSNMLLLADDVQVVGIDEAQFFDEGIVEVANALANQGKRVVIAGLDKDFKGRPFGPMPNLLATAEYVTKLHAICRRTGEPLGLQRIERTKEWPLKPHILQHLPAQLCTAPRRHHLPNSPSTPDVSTVPNLPVL
jgi:thymidine kinase